MKIDALGRRSRSKPVSTGVSLRITEKDVAMLLALQRHGILPTNYLSQFHRSSLVYTQNRLTKLTHEKPKGYGHLISRPPQQQESKYYLSNYTFYQLTAAGRKWLEAEGLTEPAIKPSGGFKHMCMISAVTASIEIKATEQGFEFIPGHVILGRSGASLGWEKILTPDQLFALRYDDGSYVAFCVECDRGTEQVSFSEKRKTYQGNYQHYKRFVGEKRYKHHYGLHCPLKVLNVMNSAVRMRAYLDLIDQSSYMLFQHIEGFDWSFRSPEILPELVTGNWQRSGYEPANIYQ